MKNIFNKLKEYLKCFSKCTVEYEFGCDTCRINRYSNRSKDSSVAIAYLYADIINKESEISNLKSLGYTAGSLSEFSAKQQDGVPLTVKDLQGNRLLCLEDALEIDYMLLEEYKKEPHKFDLSEQPR